MHINLHPKHGVNPMITVCFFCLQDKGEMVLLGNNYPGEAPMRGLLRGDRTPCKECAALMRVGILCLHVNTERAGEDIPDYSGMKMVVKEALIRRTLKPASAERVCKDRYVLMGDGAWDAMGLPREELPGVPTSFAEFEEQHGAATCAAGRT